MKDKIYIASHSKDEAVSLANKISKSRICTRWITWDFNPTHTYSDEDKKTIALKDYDDVMKSDILVIQAGSEKYSGGKFVEVGIALGAGKKVCIIGRRENMLMWHPSIMQFDTEDEFLNYIGEI